MRACRLGGLAVLLLWLAARPAAAQQSELFAGAGATFSGPDLSRIEGNAMGGVTVNFPGLLGVRVDGAYTNIPQTHLTSISGDVVLHATDNPRARFRPYALAGATLHLPSGSTHAGFNGGVGLRVQASPPLAFFAEGRYFRIRDYTSQADELIMASAGLRFEL